MGIPTIVMVEDSRVESELLHRSLSAAGYEVVWARNGVEGLAAVQLASRETAGPTLVMSDIRMPLMNGYDLCRAIKQDAALAHIPVILLSVLSEPEDIIAAINAGADSYIIKPYAETDLMERISSLLATPLRRRAAGPLLEVDYGGKHHSIAGDAQQMLNLLLSVYQSTLAQNRTLMAVQAQLSLLNETLEDKVAERTEQLRASEARLEQRVEARTAELKAANAELEHFAYAVSHDLRTPLTALNGFSQILMAQHAADLGEEGRGCLEHILEGSKRMRKLIDGLLTLARSVRGGLRRGRVDLSATAERVLGDLASAEPGRKVGWEVEPGLVASGDARMLEVLLANLLSNAWKYTARRADARIRVYAQKAGDDTPRFCVADNGAGFDMAQATRLFQPFQRLHDEQEFAGLGIGLATTHRIVERHGGTIEAQAKVGEGAVFCFSLPVFNDEIEEAAGEGVS